MDNFNIMFTSVGRRVSLIRHFKHILQSMRLPGKIVTADMQKNAPASFIGDVRELIPRVTEPKYIEAVKEICLKHNIRLLIPLIDTELQILADHKQDFAAIAVTVLVSTPEVNEICFDKKKTYQFFKNIGVATPRQFAPEQDYADVNVEYPLFLKPVNGSCSIGATKIRNFKELQFFMDYIPNNIVQEFVTGEEYTADVLVDFNGRVRSIVPRLRIETRAGEISKGITIKHSAIIAECKKVVESLRGAVGCITVQCFLCANGDIKFIEINPRFGGGFPLALKAGADFPRWIIEMMLGKHVWGAIDDWQEGVVMLRYDDEIFVAKEDIV